MVLYLSIQLRCRSKKYIKMFIKRPTHKNGNNLILFSYLEELFYLKWKQLIPLSSASWSSKRDTFYVKWQPGTSNDEKTFKPQMCLLIERNCNSKPLIYKINWNYLPLS